jgi:addiction module HigA family antidote
MMKMYNPPHPGEIIQGLWLEPTHKSIAEVANAMGISHHTLSNIINGKAPITPEIAVRLAITLGGSTESWLGHQMAYDLWQIEQHQTEINAHPLLI